MNLRRILLVVLVLSPCILHADEGMWRPRQLPDLKPQLGLMGMTMDPGRLSDLMGHPMNAVISLGGCTASFVSPDGLVITNHHCAYGTIQHNSTHERNLLRDGFLAKTRSEELSGRPGTRVYVTVDVSDVTARVMEGLPQESDGHARYQAIEGREKALVAECEKDIGHRCKVVAYHGGLEYELVKQLEIRDVRLVHAPAGSIGRYGGDIDNWMWPRHTGDYSFYRAYVGRGGLPADYSPQNVPYQPRHFLRISAEGVEEGSLVFAAGYPGRTSRYRLAAEVDSTFNWEYPVKTRLYDQWLEIIEKETAGRPDAAVKYASLVSNLNNSSKNNRGMLNGFARSDMLERKLSLESDLQAWIGKERDREEVIGSALKELRELVSTEQALRERDLYYEYLARRSELLRTARKLYRLSVEKEKPDIEREPGYQERDMTRIRESLERIDRSFDPSVDKAFWRQFIANYASTPLAQHVKVFDEWFGISEGRVDDRRLDERLDQMYAQTDLGDSRTRLGWMEASRQQFEASEDPFIALAVRLFDSDMAIEQQREDLEGRFQAVRPRYMSAMIAFLASRGLPTYPDANSTLRVTYGTVAGYRPRDGVFYDPFTSLRGIPEKDTGHDPFDAPREELAAIGQKRFGPYRNAQLHSVPVNFLATLDSTGGNSGSPALNAKGELVGLLFDGNWESIVSDWDFLPDLTRSIQVDMMYVLWVMDEVVGAHELMREMGVTPGKGAVASDGAR